MDCKTSGIHNLFSADESNIKFRDLKLQDIFHQFILMPVEKHLERKAVKNMVSYEKQFRKICQNLKLHLGSNVVEEDILKGIEFVMKRDYRKQFNSDKIQLFVPTIFLSKFPEVYQYDEYIKNIGELKVIQDINELEEKLENEIDPEKKERMSQRLAKEQQKFQSNRVYIDMRTLDEKEKAMVKSLQSVRGERAEKKMFKSLQKYFSKTNEEVLVLKSFDCLKSWPERNMKPVEKDFILFNLTKRYIMPLEVKANFSIKSLEKAGKQIEDAIKLINEWAGGDLTEDSGWEFHPATYFECDIPDIDRVFCTNCIPHVIYGEAYDEQVEKMLHEIPSKAQENYQEAKREFIKICGYFIFFLALEPIIRPSRLTQKVSETVFKPGKAEIIEMYRCWTPDQLPLLKSRILKVLFMAAPSTGKTTLMVRKALYCFQEGQNVVFIIPFGYQNKIRTLLALKMAYEWEKLNVENPWSNKFQVISIKTKWYSKGSYNILKIDYDHLQEVIESNRDAAIFADELSVYNLSELRSLLNIVKDRSKANSDRCTWLAITVMRQSKISPEQVQVQFEKNEFYVPKLSNPIRNSSAVVEYAYPSIKGFLRIQIDSLIQLVHFCLSFRSKISN